MTKNNTQRVHRRINEIADAYRKEGYEVFVEPARLELPQFLRPFRPDLIARKGSEGIVVEVKTRSKLAESKELKELARTLEERPNWKLEIVLTNPREINFSSQENGKIGYSIDEAANLFEKASKLLEAHELEASILVGIAAFEALLRLIAEKEKVSVGDKSSLHNAKHLMSYGLLSKNDYDNFEKLNEFRNLFSHGFKSTPIKTDTIAAIINRWQEILQSIPHDRSS